MVFIQCQKNHTITTKATTYSKHYEQEETCLQSGSTDNEDDRITAGESSISSDQARNKARKLEKRHEEPDCCGTYHAEQEEGIEGRIMKGERANHEGNMAAGGKIKQNPPALASAHARSIEHWHNQCID